MLYFLLQSGCTRCEPLHSEDERLTPAVALWHPPVSLHLRHLRGVPGQAAHRPGHTRQGEPPEALTPTAKNRRHGNVASPRPESSADGPHEAERTLSLSQPVVQVLLWRSCRGGRLQVSHGVKSTFCSAKSNGSRPNC